MSGLAGIVFSPAPAPYIPPLDRLAPVLRWLRHRSTGGVQHWQDRSCALASLRPASPQEGEETCLFDQQGGCTLVWDGRLDNRNELAGELLPGEPAAHVSEARILLTGYGRWGRDLPAHLDGDFALALWDARARSLLLARDGMGVRPLFYAELPGGLAFASEAGALAHSGLVADCLDDVMVSEYLLWWSAYPGAGRTFFKNVRRLPPGHARYWTRGKSLDFQHWDIDPDRRVRYRDHREYAEHFLQLFRDAVHARVVPGGNTAVLLSGGLDSSSVAGMAGRVAARPERIVAITGEIAGRGNESGLAATVARMASVQFRPVAFPPRDALHALPAYVRRQQSPVGELFFVNDLQFMHQARAGQCSAMLTGDGADEVFGSPWGYAADLLRTLRWGELVMRLRPFARYYGYGLRTALRRIAERMAPAWPIAAWKFQRWRHAPAWVHADLAERTGLRGRLRTFSRERRFRSLALSEDYFALMRGRRIWKTEAREIEAAHQGLAFRYPFFARRLLEFMFAIPWTARVDGHRCKPFLRDAPDLLPAELQTLTRKADYSDYYAKFMAAQDWNSLRPLFTSPPLAARPFVEATQLPALWQAGAANPAGPGVLPLVTIAKFLIWQQQPPSYDGN
jgi:asparagine synthase (glutamine-hydrolysing)